MDPKVESRSEVQLETSSRQVPPFPGMVWIPGGTFQMGSDKFYAEERPIHKVTIDGFWIDQHTVTNEEWSRFVQETGYVSLAERPAKAEDYPGAAPEMLAPASVVFRMPKSAVDLTNCYDWWTYVKGADWQHPSGPESSIQDKAKHPVVHVAYEDVEAYAKWIEKICRPKESGNSRLGAVSMAPISYGATTSRLVAFTWRIHGRGNSPGRTSSPMASKERRPSEASPPIVTVSMTWRATSGSGPKTGSRNTAKSSEPAARA